MEKRLSVLVPIDFSPYSHDALAHALAWAARVPCEIHLVHVVADRAGEDARSVTGDLSHLLVLLAQAAEVQLAKLPEALRPKLRPVEQHVVAGVPADEIVALATRLGVTAIVMGSHGRTGLTHLVTGSVAEHVVRRAPCPVLCVKLASTVPDPSVGRPFLCAVDFSATSRHATQVAVTLAQCLGVELQLLHVYQTPAQSPDGIFLVPVGAEDLRLAADAALAEWAETVRAVGWPAVTTTSQLGSPAHEITRIARERGCEIIVIGTHGRSGLAHAFLGSVAEKVMRTAACPVLAVHAASARVEASAA